MNSAPLTASRMRLGREMKGIAEDGTFYHLTFAVDCRIMSPTLA
jgi:hypothetical protein